MDKTTKNKMDKKKCNNSPTQIQHRKSIKKPKNQSGIMTILDNALFTFYSNYKLLKSIYIINYKYISNYSLFYGYMIEFMDF